MSMVSMDIHPRLLTDDRNVFKQMPKTIHALIIHRRYYEVWCASLIRNLSNVCVECTLVNRPGDAHIDYTKVLFSAVAVAGFVTKTKSNLIVSLL